MLGCNSLSYSLNTLLLKEVIASFPSSWIWPLSASLWYPLTSSMPKNKRYVSFVISKLLGVVNNHINYDQRIIQKGLRRVSWQMKIVMSLIAQVLWTINLTGWWWRITWDYHSENYITLSKKLLPFTYLFYPNNVPFILHGATIRLLLLRK